MSNRVGTIPAGQAIEHIKIRLKEYTDKDVPPDMWLELINTKVWELHELLGATARDIYKDKYILSLPAGSAGGFVMGGSSATYTNSTRTIYIPAAKWADGSFSPGISSAANLPIGSIVIIKEQSGATYPHYSQIESITDATKFVINSAYGGNLSDTFDIMIIMPSSADTINLKTMFSDYSYIDQILAIYDSGIGEACNYIPTVDKFYSVSKRGVSYTWKNSIIWTRDSEYLYFKKGASVSSYGTRTMHYSRKPYGVSAEADVIDIPNAWLDLFYSSMILAGLQILKVPIPQELKSAEAQISAMKKEKNEEIAKLEVGAGDN